MIFPQVSCLLSRMNEHIHIEERQRIARILNGNHEEYAYFVNAYSGQLIDFTSRMVQDRKDAEELAQDAFVKAYRSLATFGFQSSFYTWLCRIAYHESLNHLKRQKVHYVDIGDTPLADEEISDMELSTGLEERILLLEEAIDDLSPTEQMLVHLFYYKERPLREIAFIMDMKPNAVANRLHRIRKKLLRIIQGKENGQSER